MNEQTRREFLRKAIQIGGWAAVCSLGEGAIEDARGFGLLHGVADTPSAAGGGGSNTSWANWDETTEAGWGDSTVYIATYTGGLGDNETGQGGGLAGANLVLTQINNVAAASGTPSSREISHPSNQAFEATDTFWQTFIGNAAKTWTWLSLLENIAPPPEDTYGTLFYTGNGAIAPFIECQVVVATKLMKCMLDDQDSEWEVMTTTAAVPTTGKVYFGCWADGVHGVRFGWSTTRFTKWSDIPATQRVEMTGKGNFSTTSLGSNQCFFREMVGATTVLGCKAYWTLMSTRGSIISAA